MPKTKFQGIIFGLLMSLTMAYGMEVYNVALKEGGLAVMTNRVFLEALLESAYMWILVFLFSNLWGNRLGFKLAQKLCRPQDNPFLHTIFISSCTVLIMCPTMSTVSYTHLDVYKRQLFHQFPGRQSAIRGGGMEV